ncbi:hypothetical protein F4801DRAFT_577314 [Xylaria longipes]|nr:hypothetical protein F4801DRAFT_577314 [Xylaria longipes]
MARRKIPFVTVRIQVTVDGQVSNLTAFYLLIVLWFRAAVHSHTKSLQATITWLRARAITAEDALRALRAQLHDDNDDDEDEDEPRAVGSNLRQLWLVAGGPAREGPRAGGRRRLSGPAMIAAAAARILADCTPSPLPLSPHCLPCLLAPLGAVENRGRPTWSMTIPSEGGSARRQFQAMAYHVTWCAANDQPPPPRVARWNTATVATRSGASSPYMGSGREGGRIGFGKGVRRRISPRR